MRNLKANRHWRKHLSEGTIKRYSDFNNRPEGIYLNCTFVLIDKIEFLANKVVGER
nr:MAG TPA: hypothetical protein [Crassvirales sp.]